MIGVAMLKIKVIRPFNLHPEKWFEGYPVKSTLQKLPCKIYADFSRVLFLLHTICRQIWPIIDIIIIVREL